MSGPHPPEMPDQWGTGEIEVAECVEQLVADEFVCEAQPAIVQDASAADHDRIVERAAERKTGGLQARQVVEQPERTCRCKLSLEGARLKTQHEILTADQRIVEIDLEAHREAVLGQQSSRRAVLADT